VGYQVTATHCNTVQHSATHCNMWAIVCEIHLCGLSGDCNTLQHTATHCNTPQHTATHCNTLQHTATHCNALQHTATHCNTLQHTATHCNTLQHTATHMCAIMCEILLCGLSCVRWILTHDIGWRRLIGCLKLHVIFRQRPTNYRGSFAENDL